MTHKTPKISTACIFILTELLKEYGPQRMGYLKSYFQAVEKVACGTVALSKAEAMNLFKEAIMFMGKEVVDGYTRNLKELQLKDLAAFHDNWDKVTPIAPRGL